MNEQPVIFFDGVCNLCNAAVRFIIKRDTKAQFIFCSLQSEAAHALLKNHDLHGADFKSFLLLQNNKFYTRSEAALRVARQLKSPYKFLYGFIIVPPFIRNWVYDLISANRYKWFGKREECMIPDGQLSKRFLN
jgi:predicted DCC family thiol-disulfide oxidoreductase YuxK